MADLHAERQRRQSLSQQLETLLKARPGEWIPMRELASVGGIGGWRTRLSEMGRRRVDPLHIEHNGLNGAASCHRYLPYAPLGRDASVPAADRWPVFDAPSQEPWNLTSESAEK